jgi:hypothetical protein
VSEDRWEEIEPGDLVFYRSQEDFRESTQAEIAAGAGPNAWPLRPDPSGKWHQHRGKAFVRESGGWRLFGPLGPLVVREHFLALRKAPGKGESTRRPKRFEKTDTVVVCQVCGELWLGNSGRLPHHGYERPEIGWQTDSCAGALGVPYAVLADPNGAVKEIGREIIRSVIASLDRQIATYAEMIATIEAGMIPLALDACYDNLSAGDVALQPLTPEGADYAARQTALRDKRARQMRRLTEDRSALEARYARWQPGGAVDRAPYSSSANATPTS